MRGLTMVCIRDSARGRNLHLTGQLGDIDRLAGLLANKQFGQCWWSRQTANMTNQYAVGAHQHGRFLLRWTAEHHAATGCPRANWTRWMHAGTLTITTMIGQPRL